MIDERPFERLAAHAGPVDVDPGFEDRLYAVLLEERRRSTRSWRPALLLVAALLAVLTISTAVAIGSGIVKLPWPTESAAPGPTGSAVQSPEPSVPTLPDLGLPGFGPAPAGDYGFTGGGAAMHWVGPPGDPGELQLSFSHRRDCFSLAPTSVPPAPAPTPVRVAGLDGHYVEPYNVAGVLFHGGRLEHNVTTGAYALPIGDQTLCVYLSWDTDASAEKLREARQIVESIRGEPYRNTVRIVFTLPSGWDRG
ncbi:MAG TPA: hypothetical protein VFY43_01855 [Candidatus Limnocylindria bacterium]|nr:hypothetical protein [Candidatus Limnocylindria bacterium]